MGNPRNAVIRSAFGDTEILILAISALYELRHHITIDNVSSKKRDDIWLGTTELTEECCLALVGIYAFSGNHYTWYFFKRGKNKMLEDSW